MKKLLLIIGLFLLSVLQTNGQDWNNKRDSIRYAVAYEYVVNDNIMKVQEIILSDRVISTNFSFFDKILKPYIIKDNESDYDYLEKLYKVDKNSINPTSITELKYPIERKNGKIMGVLSFSIIVDGFLFANVYFSDFIPPFGEWIEYCFIFDLDNTIKEVFRDEIQGL